MSTTKAAIPKQHSHKLYNTPVFFATNHVRKKKKLNSRQKDASSLSHLEVFLFK